jgi:hypothetical protein
MELEKITSKIEENDRRLAASVRDSTVGDHVFKIVAATGTLSLSDLLAALEAEIAAPGKLRRMRAEEALSHLRSLLPPP